ncbi:MAG: penicillin-binding transpeptidase domain-containing protein, partial [Evtepia sp.]
MNSKKTPASPEHKKRATTQSMKRILWLMGIFGVFTFCVLFLKLWSIQIVNDEYYKEKAIANQTSDVAVSANRGTIYDAKGNILALSADVQNVIISPRDVVEKKLDPDLIANGLAEILSLDPAKIRKRIDKTNSAWEPIATKIEDDLADQVRQFILDNKLAGGVYLTTDSKRYYPYSSLASQVIGFVNSENKGAYGLEAIYNSDLAGENGRIVTTKNASGTEMPSGFEAYVDAQDGYNLNLTIDASIQYFAQSTVEEGIRRFEVSEGAFCIVMNPKTGAIYAMVSSPGYDLNKPNAIFEPNMAAKIAGMKANASEEAYLKALGDAQFAQWRNKALNDSYEPGSTFKPIVVAAALEEGAISENDTYFCNGVQQVQDRRIHCSKRTGHGTQSLRQTLMNSCNPALIQIGAKLGAERFYKYWQDFGFSEKTGIELQGESESLFWDPDQFIGPSGIVSLATASFGQRFKVTPMQLITAISAV